MEKNYTILKSGKGELLQFQGFLFKKNRSSKNQVKLKKKQKNFPSKHNFHFRFNITNVTTRNVI